MKTVVRSNSANPIYWALMSLVTVACSQSGVEDSSPAPTEYLVSTAVVETPFVDKAAAWNLTRIHTGGGPEKRYIVEAKGGGAALLDAEGDGDLDIYVTRGHIVQLIAELQPGKGLSYEQPDQLLENDGRGRFKDISARSGAWFSKRFVGRGAAFGDYDNDGDIDVYIVNLSQKGVLLRNNTVEGGRGGWVGLALRGGGPCNRDAYGSRVELRVAGRTRVAEVRSAASYLVANDPRVVFGLAAEPVAGLQARVRWADGLVEVFENLEAGRYQDLQRGKGRAAR